MRINGRARSGEGGASTPHSAGPLGTQIIPLPNPGGGWGWQLIASRNAVVDKVARQVLGPGCLGHCEVLESRGENHCCHVDGGCVELE